MPYSVVSCCEVDKHSPGILLSPKAILDVLFQQGDLVTIDLLCRKPTCSCGSNGSMIALTRA